MVIFDLELLCYCKWVRIIFYYMSKWGVLCYQPYRRKVILMQGAFKFIFGDACVNQLVSLTPLLYFICTHVSKTRKET